MSATKAAVKTIATKFVERAKVLGYKGKARDNAALDYMIGAATGAEVAGNERLASHLASVAVLLVSVRGYMALAEIALSVDAPLTVTVKPYKGEFMGTHRQGRLSSFLSEAAITRALGVQPDGCGDGDKVTIEWHFVANGQDCAIWDYKGARWSFYGPSEIFLSLFPGQTVAD